MHRQTESGFKLPVELGSFAAQAPDPLLRYIVEARPLFEAVKRSLIHLAGFTLKKTTSRHKALAEYELLKGAEEALAEAKDGMRSLSVPAAAAHHHHHIRAAANALTEGILSALSLDADADERLSRALDGADHHVRAAGRCMPGFVAVDLTQSCCAAHQVHKIDDKLSSKEKIQMGKRRHGHLFDLGS